MKVIARQGEAAYLVALDDTNGRVLDVTQGRFFSPVLLGSILARGYWEPAEMEPGELARLIETVVDDEGIKKAADRGHGVIAPGDDPVRNTAALRDVDVADVEHLRGLSLADVQERVRGMESDLEGEVEYGGNTAYSPICLACARLRLSEDGYWVCEAFPERIPPAMWQDAFDHRQPYPGDRGILFEMAEGAEPELAEYEESKERRANPVRDETDELRVK